jgi:tetratricopeptide (TPR) repeat protein
MMGIIEADSLALAWNEKAIALAESTKDTRARGWLGALYNNVGWIHHDAGRYEPALDTFTKALAYRLEKGQEPEVRIARWCIARCKRSLGRTGEALAEQGALLAEFERIGQADGYVHEEIAECLSIQGLSAQARPHFARAYEILSQDAWFAANEAERLARLKELGAAR